MNQFKTIIIADDHPLMAEGLTSIIHDHTAYRVIDFVQDGKTLLHRLNSLVPDLILLDINMPQLDGFEAARQIKLRYPEVKIVNISMYTGDFVYKSLLKIGVDGFIPKITDTEIIVDTLKRIMEGEKVFLNTNAEPQLKENVPTDAFEFKLKLSEREIEIIKLIKKGLTTKEISEYLHLSSFTIDTHRKNICRKLNISSPNTLVKFAFGSDF